MSKRIVLNSLSYHGEDALLDINTEARRRNLQKALIIADEGLLKIGVVDIVTKVFTTNKLDFDMFTDFKANPSVRNLKDALKALKESKADYIVALGGGSAMTVGKILSVVIKNPEFEDFESLEGEVFSKNRPMPMFAIPTTAGSGAEATDVVSFNCIEKQKQYLSEDVNYVPTAAFIDSKLMKKMPRGLAASTGLDALTHAIESYISRDANPITEMYSLEAIKLLGGSLKKAIDGDEEALANVAMGQYMAGQGYTNGGLGICHSMADALGAVYDTPHGLANAIILPTVLEYNQKGTKEKYKYIARALGKTGLTIMTKEQYREEAVNAVKKLVKDLGIPKDLKNFAEMEDIDTLVNIAVSSVHSKSNPRTVTQGVIRNLFLQLMED